VVLKKMDYTFLLLSVFFMLAVQSGVYIIAGLIFLILIISSRKMIYFTASIVDAVAALLGIGNPLILAGGLILVFLILTRDKSNPNVMME
jgi:hypothetical protein